MLMWTVQAVSYRTLLQPPAVPVWKTKTLPGVNRTRSAASDPKNPAEANTAIDTAKNAWPEPITRLRPTRSERLRTRVFESRRRHDELGFAVSRNALAATSSGTATPGKTEVH